MRYRRRYFYDHGAHTGVSPVDRVLGVTAGCSAGLRRLAVKLAATAPYETAAGILGELGGNYLASSHIWTLVQQAGHSACAYQAEQAREACALPDLDQISRGIALEPVQLAATLDGVMLNIRKEGWKEAKIGCVGQIVPVPERQPTPRLPNPLAGAGLPPAWVEPEREHVRAIKIDHVFHLGPPEPFGERLWALAHSRHWLAARNTSVVGDGAPWVWNVAQGHFPYATHVVDWYHATQHLWSAAHARFGPTDPRAAQWVASLKTRLFDRDAAVVSKAISDVPHASPSLGSEARTQLLRDAGYFADNAARMRYKQFRAAGLPIGSGTVESGAKQFKSRFSASGMRWNRQAVQHLMPFRAALMSHSFDAFWASVCP